MNAAGDLRQRVTVMLTAEVSDGHDGFIDAPAPVKSRIAAKVKPLAGRDLERARQIDPRISHEVTLRYWRAYRSELDGGRASLIYHDGTRNRPLEIIGPPVDVEERHERLQLFCRESP